MMIILLEEADRLLAGDIAVPSESRRGACWLARAVLEDAVRKHLEVRGYRTGNASMRALLACLECAELPNPTLARTARHAWIGLSQASHHHAYELAPTLAEVRHLVGLVEHVSESFAQVQGLNQKDPRPQQQHHAVPAGAPNA